MAMDDCSAPGLSYCDLGSSGLSDNGLHGRANFGLVRVFLVFVCVFFFLLASADDDCGLELATCMFLYQGQETERGKHHDDSETHELEDHGNRSPLLSGPVEISRVGSILLGSLLRPPPPPHGWDGTTHDLGTRITNTTIEARTAR